MFSNETLESLKKSSFIRAMFEEGTQLKKIHGEENVFDFSIGNPDMEPPEEVNQAIMEISSEKIKGIHKYMSNAGYDSTRQAVSMSLMEDYGVHVPFGNVVMVCGAAAGMAVTLKSILNPGEEVLVFSPYFAEYLFYVKNAGGIPVPVPTHRKTFMPDLALIEKAITPRTKAVIINSPNNPTGVIYPEEVLHSLAKVIGKKEKELGIHVFVLSDEPYTKLVFDGSVIPCVFDFFEKSVIITSYSKTLALPGERIGYIAVNPGFSQAKTLLSALIFNNRTLGFVNAPAIAQRIIEKSIRAKVNLEEYRVRMETLYTHMISLGFRCKKPQGAFYLFVESPYEDEMIFIEKAKKYNILVVPGRGFGLPGTFRMAFCIEMEAIQRALPALTKLAGEIFGDHT
ncbi:MAG: pyridoxal phosphate-dependent aminotransferase [Clostridia bacterium]